MHCHVTALQVQDRNKLLDQLWGDVLGLHGTMLAAGAKTGLATSRWGSLHGRAQVTGQPDDTASPSCLWHLKSCGPSYSQGLGTCGLEQCEWKP